MLNLNFQNFPEIHTERLLLRKLSADDVQQVHKLRSDEVINRYLDRPNSTGIEDALAFIKKIDELIQTAQCFYWAITIKPADALIGTICLWNYDAEHQTIEIGYELMAAYQGKGIISEAAREVINFVFNKLKANVITAFPSADNEKSVAVLERLGFRRADIDLETMHGVDNMVKYILVK